jgi:hypothetical protein
MHYMRAKMDAQKDQGEGMNVAVLTELQGERRWHNTIVEPLRDGNGKVTAAMGLVDLQPE